ncbi:MAG: SGNH/GDSL hydrolase family protein, partial [Janthinobacterium lividum]
TLVSAAKGWREINLGRGGTGYVATAGFDGCGRDFCGDYASRVEEAAGAHPARVVVAGGQNDFVSYSTDPVRVRAAVTSTYAALRKACPDAELVVVGPSTTGVVDVTVTSFDEMVRTAAADNHASYISLLQPPVIRPAMIAPDGVHVNDVGHRAIADRIISRL